MNVNELLDIIEDTLEEGTSIPLSGGKRVVDVDKIRDYLDDIRLNLPGEIRQAKTIVNDRAQILDDAKKEAAVIVKKAEERAAVLVSETEVLKAAEQRAAEVTANAQAEAERLRQGCLSIPLEGGQRQDSSPRPRVQEVPAPRPRVHAG